jgi:exopolyphosphatase/guanosine-5'-triphosphate,3'-diphosphate pyrophosphatase
VPSSTSRIAAIDIGSNSIRGVVAEVAGDGTYRIIDDERFQTRLGANLATAGAIGPDRIAASLEALDTLLAVAASRGVTTVRAVATAALRSASNGHELLNAARDRFGLEIEIIDGETEGRFAFASASANFELPDPACVIDIGGGSLEIVLALGGQITHIHSLPLGAVRMLSRLPADQDPPSPRALRALRTEVRTALHEVLGDHPPRVGTIIGSGGTITSLVGVAAANRGESPVSLQGAEASADEIRAVFARLSAVPSAARAKTPGLAVYRADTVISGGVVVGETLRLFGATRLLANQRGLREGILLDTIARLGREGGPTSLRAVALKFGERCHFDRAHAEHVTNNALGVFDALAAAEVTGDDTGRLHEPRSRQLLEVAALLHDVGYFIGHDKHHRHSWNLIIHAPLPGLTAREQALVAAIARYHRGAHPKPAHEALARITDSDRPLVRLLAGILRVADGLDRSQTGRVTGVSIERRGAALVVVAHGEGNLEVELYGARAKSELLARALGTAVAIEAQG